MFCPSLPDSAKGGGELHSFSVVCIASFSSVGKALNLKIRKNALFDNWYILCSLYLKIKFFNFGSGEAEALGASAGG